MLSITGSLQLDLVSFWTFVYKESSTKIDLDKFKINEILVEDEKLILFEKNHQKVHELGSTLFYQWLDEQTKLKAVDSEIMYSNSKFNFETGVLDICFKKQ